MKNTKTFPQKMAPTDARDFFTAKLKLARELLRLIEGHVDANMGVDLARVHWGHVGDAGRLVEDLREICHTLILK